MATGDLPQEVPPPESTALTVTPDEKLWGMLAHLSSLVAGLVALPFLGPLIVWLIKKDTSKFVDYHGKEALNFQLNMLVAILICVALVFCGIGIFLLPIVGIFDLVMTIIAAVKANSGELYRYPAIYRMI